MGVTKTYKSIWFGGPQPYLFSGFRWAFMPQTPVAYGPCFLHQPAHHEGIQKNCLKNKKKKNTKKNNEGLPSQTSRSLLGGGSPPRTERGSQGAGSTSPLAYSLAICSKPKLAIAKTKANYDQWPLEGYPVRKAGSSSGSPILSTP